MIKNIQKITLNDLNFIYPYLVKEAKDKLNSTTVEYDVHQEDDITNKLVSTILSLRMKDTKAFKREIDEIRKLINN